jgi:hypothetical protein
LRVLVIVLGVTNTIVAMIYHGWSKERVYNVVGKVITVEEYEEITGEPYDA